MEQYTQPARLATDWGTVYLVAIQLCYIARLVNRWAIERGAFRMMPDIYRALAVLMAGGIPSTMLVDQGLPTVEKYGIVGLLFIFCLFFVKLWRDADRKKSDLQSERIKMLEEIVAKKDTELELERAKKGL